jgi:hypothetical protein
LIRGEYRFAAENASTTGAIALASQRAVQPTKHFFQSVLAAQPIHGSYDARTVAFDGIDTAPEFAQRLIERGRAPAVE